MDWSILLGDFWNPLHYDGMFDSVSDYFTGYTSANQQNRFSQQGMALQNAYTAQNMARQDAYQRNLMRDAPSLQKEGLAKAGFNPMLAVQGGISSPSSGVSASTPSFSAPSPHGFGLGDVINAVSSAGSIASLGSDIALKDAQAEAARSQAVNASADAGLKAAQTLNQPSIKENIDADTTKKTVESITSVVTPLVTAGASAYGVKKSTDLAREGLRAGLTKESAKRLAMEATGKSPRVFSAGSAGKALQDFGLLAVPLLLGAGSGAMMYKAQKDAMKKGKISFTNHMSAGW